MQPAEQRHQDAIVARLEATMRREMRDLPSLQAALMRALSDPDVRHDPSAQSRLRAVESELEIQFREQIAEQERALQAETARIEPPPVVRKAAPPAAPAKATAPPDDLRVRFETAVAHFELAEARQALQEMRAAAATQPAAYPPPILARLEARLRAVEQQQQTYLSEIRALEARALEAARRGDEGVAAAVVQRLQAINALRPALLSARDFVEMRERITAASASFEHHETMKSLLSRERHVAREIIQMGERIRSFHRVAHEAPHTDPRYLAAEREYHDAVNALRAHDEEWFAALIVELEDLVEELHDPQAQVHADKFLDSLRRTLRHLRRETAEIEGEKRTPPPGPAGGPHSPP